MSTSPNKLDEIRKACLDDLYVFASTINPNRYYGKVHREMFKFLQSEDMGSHQLVLIPREHQKSHCIAVWAVWWITNNPWTTIAYVSGTNGLAVEQIYAIKNMMDNKIYKRLWPDMLAPENYREEWTKLAIKVDHPLRKEQGVRDSTVRATSAGSSNTGFHADVIIFDDLITEKNYDSATKKKEVEKTYAAFSSIATANSIIKAVGTRYAPDDLYSRMLDASVDVRDDNGQIIDSKPLYTSFVREVEEHGEFLWPAKTIGKKMRYGFDWEVLERKRSNYRLSGKIAEFYAQYYNNPNTEETYKFSRDVFQYYDRKFITIDEYQCRFNGEPLSVWAAVDPATTMTKKSDYTAITVCGMDKDKNIYVLDIERFKTDKIDKILNTVIALHEKWKFRKLRVEAVQAQNLLAQYIKDKAAEQGLRLIVSPYKPPTDLHKKERISIILDPLYLSNKIWHYEGGNCSILEEELIQSRPSHDDISDAFASTVEIAKPPRINRESSNIIPVDFHPEFGGII